MLDCKGYQGQTPKLIGTICKLQIRKGCKYSPSYAVLNGAGSFGQHDITEQVPYSQHPILFITYKRAQYAKVQHYA
jgi:hypothetical protein